ncbi:MAG: ribonuclease PH [Gemmatimonadetes bacterium]|nr:ribonuclease PH [Gemmatimonadota bacterium]
MTDHPPLRADRLPGQLRAVTFRRGAAPYAEGSCLVTAGRTTVLCTATVQEEVPPWRRGAGAGWVTAEYAMLPRATHTRTARERGKVGGRTQEIQRLVGRALRAAADLQGLGERTVFIDCDVIIADGGTRTAAITGAAIALHDAGTWLLRQGLVAAHPMRELVAATSVGIIGGEPRLDLEYHEDVCADVDLNLVALESGGLVEVQGTAEHHSFTRPDLDLLLDLGMAGITSLLSLQHAALAEPMPPAFG